MRSFDDLTLATTVHNNADMCAAMLRSFEANVGLVAEIILVDDGSESPCDLSFSKAPSRTIRTAKSLGFCKASNLALREVRTKYAFLVDADILFEPGDFEGGYYEFEKYKWAWVNFRQIDFQGQPQGSYEQPLMPPWIFAAGNQIFAYWQKFQQRPKPAPGQRIAEVTAAHSSCTLVNMAAFRAVGGFDPWYWQCQSDVDFSLRFRKRGYRVGVDLGYQVKHDGAGGRGGGTARVMDLYRSRVHLYEKMFPASRLYLRPLLFVRHLLELAWFAVIAPFKKDARLVTRLKMLKGALRGYN
jgi:N-acetylglucosaminyl-diphospho-decaprenol L-rhamnosyltransferase